MQNLAIELTVNCCKIWKSVYRDHFCINQKLLNTALQTSVSVSLVSAGSP